MAAQAPCSRRLRRGLYRRCHHSPASPRALRLPTSQKAKSLGKPQTVDVDLKRLGAELDLFAEEANRRRLATALTGLGIGAALVPSGVVLLGRTDGVTRSLVIGMIVGGSAQIASAPLMLIPTRMDEIRDTYRGRFKDLDTKATVRALEDEWRLAAESSRRQRSYAGTTLLCFGATNLTIGLTLLLAPEGVLGMSRKTQYTLGGVMMGVGVPTTTIGVRFLLEWSLEETSWEAYRTMKSDAAELGATALTVHRRRPDARRRVGRYHAAVLTRSRSSR